MRVAPPVELDEAQRKTLSRWARGRSTPARLVTRAKIVLLAAEGKQNQEIAALVGTNRRTVGRWRSRFAKCGLAGMIREGTRWKV